MRPRIAFAFAERDIRLAIRTPSVYLPLISTPVVSLVVLPVVLVFVTRAFGDSALAGTLIGWMPRALSAQLDAFPAADRLTVLTLRYFLAPLYLITPVIVTNTIAADGFAGEKERKTLEPLLHSPATDAELLTGKMLAAWLPAVVVGIGGFLAYTAVVDILTAITMGQLLLPSPSWVVLAVWTAPAMSALALGAMVLLSARAGTFQGAYQLGTIVVLPPILLIAGQVLGLFVLNTLFVFVLGAVSWILAVGILAFGARRITRSSMLGLTH
ncbi:ABC transporter permease subunit [Sciscionella marina]|uniref:ABC transporter permease subunit n=1 Tax=Sciscionella marina TaxID=508770 RepID=UPI00037D472B|nr:ABC transporter permease subunit [Sciscionella marina]